MKTLHLTLKKKWFDMILSGEKKEEYREITKYWKVRLGCTWMGGNSLGSPCDLCPFGCSKEFDAIKAVNGYGNHRPAFIREFKGARIGIGNPDWGAPEYPVFIIKLGEIIETKNCPSV